MRTGRWSNPATCSGSDGRCDEELALHVEEQTVVLHHELGLLVLGKSLLHTRVIDICGIHGLVHLCLAARDVFENCPLQIVAHLNHLLIPPTHV